MSIQLNFIIFLTKICDLVEDPWSEAVLYQPYEAEQILLAENASCLAVKTFLKVI